MSHVVPKKKKKSAVPILVQESRKFMYRLGKYTVEALIQSDMPGPLWVAVGKLLDLGIFMKFH